MAGLLLLLAFGAFWPMYLSKPFVALDRYTHAHAAIGLAWMLLLVFYLPTLPGQTTYQFITLGLADVAFARRFRALPLT